MPEKEKQLMVQKELKEIQERKHSFLEPNNFKDLLEASKVLVSSKILPKELDTPEKVAVVILTGRELGLHMMASTRGICVVNQRPALYAQMMLALAISTGEMEDYKVIDRGAGEAADCEVIVKRKGRTEYSYKFSVAMIKKLEKFQGEWKKQPETMCRWRAISGNLRVTFPDAILGLYTPEEAATIDDAEIIDAGGPIVTLKSNAAAPAAPEKEPEKEPGIGAAPTQEQAPPGPENQEKFGEYYELGIVAAQGAEPDYGRFGSDEQKVRNMASNFKKCAEKLGQERFMTIVGNQGVESLAQINMVQEVAALLNALLMG